MSENLPEGWESKIDPQSGRRFYIDHLTHQTSWTPPTSHVTSLPVDWVKNKDETGRVFYQNTKTGQTSWTFPNQLESNSSQTWNCSACTFQNNNSSDACEMCQSPNPSAATKTVDDRRFSLASSIPSSQEASDLALAQRLAQEQEPESSYSLVTSPKELEPYFVPNELFKYCMSCNKEFSIMFRRHHCKCCGLLLCNDCAPKNKEGRFCENCVDHIESGHRDCILKYLSKCAAVLNQGDNTSGKDMLLGLEGINDVLLIIHRSIQQNSPFASVYFAALDKYKYDLNDIFALFVSKSGAAVKEYANIFTNICKISSQQGYNAEHLFSYQKVSLFLIHAFNMEKLQQILRSQPEVVSAGLTVFADVFEIQESVRKSSLLNILIQNFGTVGGNALDLLIRLIKANSDNLDVFIQLGGIKIALGLLGYEPKALDCLLFCIDVSLVGENRSAEAAQVMLESASQKQLLALLPRSAEVMRHLVKSHSQVFTDDNFAISVVKAVQASPTEEMLLLLNQSVNNEETKRNLLKLGIVKIVSACPASRSMYTFLSNCFIPEYVTAQEKSYLVSLCLDGLNFNAENDISITQSCLNLLIKLTNESDYICQLILSQNGFQLLLNQNNEALSDTLIKLLDSETQIMGNVVTNDAFLSICRFKSHKKYRLLSLIFQKALSFNFLGLLPDIRHLLNEAPPSELAEMVQYLPPTLFAELDAQKIWGTLMENIQPEFAPCVERLVTKVSVTSNDVRRICNCMVLSGLMLNTLARHPLTSDVLFSMTFPKIEDFLNEDIDEYLSVAFNDEQLVDKFLDMNLLPHLISNRKFELLGQLLKVRPAKVKEISAKDVEFIQKYSKNDSLLILLEAENMTTSSYEANIDTCMRLLKSGNTNLVMKAFDLSLSLELNANQIKEFLNIGVQLNSTSLLIPIGHFVDHNLVQVNLADALSYFLVHSVKTAVKEDFVVTCRLIKKVDGVLFENNRTSIWILFSDKTDVLFNFFEKLLRHMFIDTVFASIISGIAMESLKLVVQCNPSRVKACFYESIKSVNQDDTEYFLGVLQVLLKFKNLFKSSPISREEVQMEIDFVSLTLSSGDNRISTTALHIIDQVLCSIDFPLQNSHTMLEHVLSTGINEKRVISICRALLTRNPYDTDLLLLVGNFMAAREIDVTEVDIIDSILNLLKCRERFDGKAYCFVQLLDLSEESDTQGHILSILVKLRSNIESTNQINICQVLEDKLTLVQGKNLAFNKSYLNALLHFTKIELQDSNPFQKIEEYDIKKILCQLYIRSNTWGLIIDILANEEIKLLSGNKNEETMFFLSYLIVVLDFYLASIEDSVGSQQLQRLGTTCMNILKHLSHIPSLTHDIGNLLSRLGYPVASPRTVSTRMPLNLNFSQAPEEFNKDVLQLVSENSLPKSTRTCKACTYINEPDGKECIVCGTAI